jgi:hypothetical protein
MDGEFAAHQVNEFLLGRGPSVNLAPLAARFEFDVGVAQICSHRVNRDFGCAYQTKQMSDFWKLFEQQLFGFLLQVCGCAQPGAAAADELEQHRAFVELRDELRAQPRQDEQR